VHVVPVLLVAAWGVTWIGFHASQRDYVYSLFQTFALAESATALLLWGRKPVGALVGILIAYLAFQLDPLLLPPLLIALYTVATSRERQTVLFATAATATIGLWAQTQTAAGDMIIDVRNLTKRYAPSSPSATSASPSSPIVTGLLAFALARFRIAGYVTIRPGGGWG
jgi:hypothetical protein